MDFFVTYEDVLNVFSLFRKRAYQACDDNIQGEDVVRKCEALIAKDYKYSVLQNSDGDLVETYPSRIFLLEKERTNNGDKCNCSEDQNIYDVVKLRNVIVRARDARHRRRFPVPVMLVDGKNVCRSATVTVCSKAATQTRTTFLSEENFQDATTNQAALHGSDTGNEESLKGQGSSSLHDLCKNDIALLKAFSVSLICDLMLQHELLEIIYKPNCSVPSLPYSSEKCEKLKMYYNDFAIWCLPYPGVGIFRDYHSNNYKAEGLIYSEWEEEYYDAKFFGPSDSLIHVLGIDFKREYKTWDIVVLTQNYMKLLLKYLMTSETSGILIHCISGWDRTPLFISLLRLSLWADGKVHKSLSVMEMFYFTLAYDWYLFGHRFVYRMSENKEVFTFCFHFLKYLTKEEFSTVLRPDGEAITKDSQELSKLAHAIPESNTSLNTDCSLPSNGCHDSQAEFVNERKGGNKAGSEIKNIPPTKFLNRKERLEWIQTLFYEMCVTAVGKNNANSSEVNNFSSLYQFAAKNLCIRTAKAAK